MPLSYDTQATDLGGNLPRLVRHLSARLGEFGADYLAILATDHEGGSVTVSSPKFSAEDLHSMLNKRGVSTQLDGNSLIFYVTNNHQFEEIDTLWGVLYSMLA